MFALAFKRCSTILFLIFALGTLGACTTLVSVPGTKAPEPQSGLALDPAAPGSSAMLLTQLVEAEGGFAKVLARHVDESGRVGFAAIAVDVGESGLPALERYVKAIAQTPLTLLPAGAPRLAHMINAYNALSMYNVIRSGLPTTHAGFAKLRFFVLRKFQIGDQRLSLYSFENDVIRKLDEPRIHFALNCSALSCPVLPRVLFAADTLDATLERETRKFFSDPANLRVDHAQRTVYFNEILRFYTEDFVPAHAPSLIAFAQRYTVIAIPSDYATGFTPYDWTVAHRP
jgi:hypothetical protein